MKIIFSLAHVGFVRNYDRTVRHLAVQGHQIHIAVLTARNKLREKSTLDRLMAEHPNVTYGLWPKIKPSVWVSAALPIRVTQDYIRYLDPRYKSSTELRKRVASKTPLAGEWFAKIFAGFGSWSRRTCLWLLPWLDRAMPVNEDVLTFLRDQKPDVLLVTPLIDVGSSQVEHVKAAKTLGIPTGLCVASWDNLTNKGLIREIPDRVFVWNESQRQEAIELHGVKSEQVVVSGAQIFDHWFEATETESRESFCKKVGLNPEYPFILYVGSSRFIAPDEALFMLQFVEELRHAPDLDMRNIGVLVRPHPTNIRHWRAFERPNESVTSDVQPSQTRLSIGEPWRVRERQPLRFENLAFWPPLESVPDDGKDSLWDFFSAENRSDYFHSIYHSRVVTGVNSSGMVEAGIVGRPVCAPVVPEFAHSQGGTLHFDHLLRAGGGLLYTAPTTEKFIKVIRERLQTSEVDGQLVDRPDPKSQKFTEAFLRPRGISKEVSPILASEIEALADLPVAPRPFFSSLYPARAVAYVIGRLAGSKPINRKPVPRVKKQKRRTPHERVADGVMTAIRPFVFVVVHAAIPLVWFWELLAPGGVVVRRSVRVLHRAVLRMIEVTISRGNRFLRQTRKQLLRMFIKRPARVARRTLAIILTACRRLARLGRLVIGSLRRGSYRIVKGIRFALHRSLKRFRHGIHRIRRLIGVIVLHRSLKRFRHGIHRIRKLIGVMVLGRSLKRLRHGIHRMRKLIGVMVRGGDLTE